MAVVVHADQHAQHVRLQLERVLLPAFLQIEHGVAADPAVDEVKVPLGKGCTKLGREEEHIAVAEDMIRVGAASAGAVGNGVPLEENAGVLVKNQWAALRAARPPGPPPR